MNAKSITLSSSNYNITNSDIQNYDTLILSGILLNNLNLILPSGSQCSFTVICSCTGGYNITIETLVSGSLTINLSSYTTSIPYISKFYSDGSNIYSDIIVRAEYYSPLLTTPGTIIQFQLKREDTNNAVTLGASWRFTAPIPGLYLLETNTYTSTGLNNVILYKNGILYRYIGNTVGASICGTSNHTLRLNQGDYLYLVTDGATNVPADVNVWIVITRLGS
jgi:hypothetical protein